MSGGEILVATELRTGNTPAQAQAEFPGQTGAATVAPYPFEPEHLVRSVQDGRKALKRATLALTFSAISAAGAWTNLGITLFRAVHHH